ncbi:hypothetical protein OJJOAM_000716 [Cupriavidus sp. H18C1]
MAAVPVNAMACVPREPKDNEANTEDRRWN